MWPISPAAPRPIQVLPSRMIPPPTPVPQKTPEQRLAALAAPSSYSAWRRPRRRCRGRSAQPELLGEGRRQRERLLPVGQVARLGHGAGLGVDGARRAHADARQPVVSTPAASAASLIVCRHLRRRPRPARPRSAWAAAPRRAPSTRSSTTTAWILVPPRSIPPLMLRAAYRRRDRLDQLRQNAPVESEALVLGVDVGGTKVAVAPVDGGPTARRLGAPDRLPAPEPLLDGIEAAVRRVIDKAGEPEAIGVGVPSQIEFATGTVETSVNIPLDRRAAARGAGRPASACRSSWTTTPTAPRWPRPSILGATRPRDAHARHRAWAAAS